MGAVSSGWIFSSWSWEELKSHIPGSSSCRIKGASPSLPICCCFPEICNFLNLPPSVSKCQLCNALNPTCCLLINAAKKKKIISNMRGCAWYTHGKLGNGNYQNSKLAQLILVLWLYLREIKTISPFKRNKNPRFFCQLEVDNLRYF